MATIFFIVLQLATIGAIRVKPFRNFYFLLSAFISGSYISTTLRALE